LKKIFEPFYRAESELQPLLGPMQVERFYAGRPEGAIKTFPIRGIKDSPPYLHDSRLLTLEDAVEFFDIILQTRLSAEEKKDVVAYLRAL